MSELSPIFQTLEDRDNPDEVEQHGPYQSAVSHWAGKGYYFWDRNINRAHWWGITHYNGNPYIICQAKVVFDDDSFFDLYNNPEHCEFFDKYTLQLEKIFPNQIIHAHYVLHHMRSKGNFPFKLMRFESENCGGDNRHPFPKYSFLNTNKAIQLCIYDKSLIHDYHIVYPTNYTIPIG